ncbi:MAG: hypothetical protein QOG80_1396 [Pseudonocardiales bacterium]|nr:hypothetical protein [Pseudonocardiales bacterium]
MPSVESAALAAAASLAVARTLGQPVDVPVLRDARLADREVVDEVVSAAAYHGVLPLLWTAVQQTEVPGVLREATHDVYLSLVARDLRLANLAQVVDAALTSAGVAYAVYKGPAVARYYPRPDLRMFGDVDVLVARHDLAVADDALRDAGLRGGWAAVPDDYAETMYVLGSSGTLDLHWHVMREALVRSAFGLDTVSMLARSSRLPVFGATAPCLDPVDLFIAVATHACFDGAYRLGWYVDLAVLLRSPDVSWDEVRSRCAATRTSLAVQVVVDRTVRTLEIVPPGRALASGPWRALLSRVSAARPVERTFRQAGRGGLIFRATRSGSALSYAALGRLAVMEALVPLVRDRRHRWRTDPSGRM